MDVGAPPPSETQHTSPLVQLSDPVHVRDTPPHCPMGAHVAPPPIPPPPPPAPTLRQHSWVDGSHVDVPHVMDEPPEDDELPPELLPEVLPELLPELAPPLDEPLEELPPDEPPLEPPPPPSRPPRPPSADTPPSEPEDDPASRCVPPAPLDDVPPPPSPVRALAPSSRTVRPPQPMTATSATADSAPRPRMTTPLFFPQERWTKVSARLVPEPARAPQSALGDLCAPAAAYCRVPERKRIFPCRAARFITACDAIHPSH